MLVNLHLSTKPKQPNIYYFIFSRFFEFINFTIYNNRVMDSCDKLSSKMIVLFVWLLIFSIGIGFSLLYLPLLYNKNVSFPCNLANIFFHLGAHLYRDICTSGVKLRQSYLH